MDDAEVGGRVWAKTRRITCVRYKTERLQSFVSGRHDPAGQSRVEPIAQVIRQIDDSYGTAATERHSSETVIIVNGDERADLCIGARRKGQGSACEKNTGVPSDGPPQPRTGWLGMRSHTSPPLVGESRKH